MSRRLRQLLVAVGAIGVLAVAGPAVYVSVINPPESLTPRRLPDGGTIAAADLAGVWSISETSIVGYRVAEQIGLSKTETVGRTEQVAGTFTVADATLQSAEFVVEVGTFASDRSQRDDQFRGRIMDAQKYPTARFVLTEPTPLPATTSVSTMDPFRVRGDLTLRDTTKSVDIEMFAALDNGRLRLWGSCEIVFAEWGIPNPSLPVALIFIADRGTLEFDLLFEPVE